MFEKSTAGSCKLIRNGTVSDSRTMRAMCMLPCLISDCDRSDSFPVSLRSRWARFNKRVSGLVSGMRKNMKMKIAPLIMIISYIDHRHVEYMTANPLRSGPTAGPENAAETQKDMAYGSLGNEKISPMDAPDVARTGLPRKPWMKRSTTSPG